MAYATPTRDMTYLLEHAAGFEAVRQTGAFDDLSSDIVAAVLTEAARLSDEVFSPLNVISDREGARIENGQVFTTPGFKEAYAQYVEGGWNGLAFPEDLGGQAMPQTLALLVFDALCGGCLSLTMGFSLTTGAVKALLANGSEEQRRLFLPKLVSGEWTGTMNLSEPHAGSDLSDLKTRAEPVGDGRYRIKGTKVWISYGDHDLTRNICHLVLARLPDAPEGTRGISMFLVPKFRVTEGGAVGERNDVTTVSIEHKMGQHGSPTCVLSFGDNDDCYGTLIGEENKGLRNMFVMMNAARIDVGMQATSVCERACQIAGAYAVDRRQGRPYGVKSGAPIAITGHPDVRRQLITMRSLTDAARAIGYATMVAHDVAHHSSDAATAAAASRREELLTPLSKAFPAQRAQEITNLGVQVHGGTGFTEDVEASQLFRDTRICSIYEGTDGIQAIDLVGRKLGMEGGRLAEEFIGEVAAFAKDMPTTDSRLADMAGRLGDAAESLRRTTAFMLTAMADNTEQGLTAAMPYLDQFGYVAGGYYLTRAAAAAADEADVARWVPSAHYYATNILPRTAGLEAIVLGGDAALPAEDALPMAG